MFTQRELKRAGDIIKQIARENHVSEDQVRADMQEAMESARRNPDYSKSQVKILDSYCLLWQDNTVAKEALWLN